MSLLLLDSVIGADGGATAIFSYLSGESSRVAPITRTTRTRQVVASCVSHVAVTAQYHSCSLPRTRRAQVSHMDTTRMLSMSQSSCPCFVYHLAIQSHFRASSRANCARYLAAPLVSCSNTATFDFYCFSSSSTYHFLRSSRQSGVGHLCPSHSLEAHVLRFLGL